MTGQEYLWGLASRLFNHYVIDLDTMVPNSGLVTSGDAKILANAAQEYVVFVRDGDSVSVDLKWMDDEAICNVL